MLIALAGCVAGDADALRTAWLVDALVDDNRPWLSRDPELLAQKYATMAADPYDYVRGTAGVFLRDLGRAGTGRAPFDLRVAEAAEVLLVGDPHPENVGTLRPGEGPGPTDAADLLLLEVVDLDGAAFGPYGFDLRRALLGLGAFLDAEGCDDGCRDAAARAWIAGWLDGVAGRATFVPGLTPGRDPVLDDLLADVSAEGAGREQLLEVTEETSAGLRFRRTPLDEAGDGLLGVDAEERAQVGRLLDALERPAGFRVHDVARRFGVGVASLPAVRYAVAWDRGDDGPEDDELLQLREVIDPPAVPGAVDPGSFDSAADRIRDTHRALWSRPDADVRLDGVADGVQAFKVTTWSSWNVALDHTKVGRRIADGRYDADALAAFARDLGAQLAAAHDRAPTRRGGDAGDAIRADLAGREGALAQALVDAARADLARAYADHARFVDALERLGPLLGAEEAPW